MASEVRYKVRFKERDAFRAAQAIEAPLPAPVQNAKRSFISLDATPVVYGGGGGGGLAAGGPRAGRGARVERNRPRDERDRAPRAPAMDDIDQSLDMYVKEYGAEIVVDHKFELESTYIDDLLPRSLPEEMGIEAVTPSLEDVLTSIKAKEAWELSQGEGVEIAVVDTGINGLRPEFPEWKKVASWQPEGDPSWNDWKGHGTMCACIAAGSSAEQGLYDGVAPKAKIIECRTRFYDSEVTTIYDFLIDRVEKHGSVIVATNSFGEQTGQTPPVDPTVDFPDALTEAIEKGIIAVFSAGNYHEMADGAPSACSPNTIWLHKSRDDVMTVGGTKLDGILWEYSSRGPGQHFGDAGTNKKPDVVAPTPANGTIVYGDAEQVHPRGWGTSGSAPQVAGLIALARAMKPDATRAEIFDAIRTTTTDLGLEPTCQGTGQIDCRRALSALS